MLEIQTRQRSVHHHLISRQMSCIAAMTRGNGVCAAVATPDIDGHYLHHRDSRTDGRSRPWAATPTTVQGHEGVVGSCSYACGLHLQHEGLIIGCTTGVKRGSRCDVLSG